MIGFAEHYIEETAFRLLTGEQPPYSVDREFLIDKGWKDLREETYQRLLKQDPTDKSLADIEEVTVKTKKEFARIREKFAAK